MRRLMIATVVLLTACGDPDTDDHRGYTKAPLEEPNVLVRGEPNTEMDRLGDPNMPDAPVIEAEVIAPEPKAAAGKKADGKDGHGQTTAPKSTVPAGATLADVEAGHTIFTSTGNCFTCHAQNGEGTAMAPRLSDSEWLHLDGSFEAIQKIVKSGVAQPKKHPAPMPAMGGATLNDQQIKQVAAYVYSISH